MSHRTITAAARTAAARTVPARTTPARTVATEILGCALASLLATAPALAGHEVRTPGGSNTTSAHLRPGTTGQFEVFSDPPGCIASVINVESQNPDVVEVYAIDEDGNMLPGDGTTATVTDVENQKFVYVPVGSGTTTQFATIRICWDEPGGADCDEANCPGVGWIFSVQVKPDPKTIGQHTDQGTGGDPIAGGTGELFMYPETFLTLGGPLDLSFSIYWAARIRTDNNIVSRLQLAWLHNYDWAFNTPTFAPEDLVEFTTPLGRVIRFEKSFFEPGWVLTPYTDVPFQLAQQDTVYTLMDPRDGLRYTFLIAGFRRPLTRIEDRNGNGLDLTYDASGRLDQVTDNLGRTLTYTYVSNRLASVSDGARTVAMTYGGGAVATVTDAAGGVTTFTYDATTSPGNPQIASMTRPEGNTTWSQTYDAALRVVTQTDAFANTTTFAYDDVTGETSITDPLTNLHVQTHSAALDMTASRDEASQTVSFSTDAEGRRTSVTDRLSRTTSWTFHEPTRRLETVTDAAGGLYTLSYASTESDGITYYDLASATGPDGSTDAYAYDSNGNILTRTDAQGHVTSFTYDGVGRLLSTTNPNGGVTSYTYNADHTLASITDPAGNVATYAYDALRRPVTITRPDASTVSYTWDALDRLTSVTDEAGGVTSYTYDANDNLTSVTTPLGTTSTYTYDAMDRLVGATDAAGGERTYTYDALGRLVGSTDPEGSTVSVTYDALGRAVAVSDANGETWSRTFDAERVLTATTDPLGASIQLASSAVSDITGLTSPGGGAVGAEHDARGRITRVTDANGHAIDIDRDHRGFVTGIALPDGVEATYVLDGLGSVTRVDDPRGNTWSYTYDDSGRRTSRSDPLGNTTTYVYDARNRPSVITHPGGLGTTTLTYDAVGRLLSASGSDGATRTFTYDADGRMISADGGAGATAFAYDAARRMTACGPITGTRDANGRLESVTLAPGKTVTYTYDGRGDVTSVTDWVGGTTTLTYDAAGRLTSVARPNGATTTYTYDADNRVATITEAGGAQISEITLTRNAAGEITEAVRDLPLSATPTEALVSLSHDVANRVAAHTHDAMGRRLDDGTRTYAWDVLSRLTQITSSGSTVTYEYDGLGLWLARTEDGVREEYVWNRMLALVSLAVVRDDVGEDVRYFVHTPDGELLHAIEASDDSRHFYHYDEIGNTVFRTDDAGAVAETYAYSPFGSVLAEAGSGPANPFTVHGRYGVIREGDLYAMRARFYDPAGGRFLSQDPVEGIDPRTGNAYQAFYGNPLLYVDPRGTDIPLTFDINDPIYIPYDSNDPGPDGVPGTSDDLMAPSGFPLSLGNPAAVAAVTVANRLAGGLASAAIGSPDYRAQQSAHKSRVGGIPITFDINEGFNILYIDDYDASTDPGPDGIPGTADDLMEPSRGAGLSADGRSFTGPGAGGQPLGDALGFEAARRRGSPFLGGGASPQSEALGRFGFGDLILQGNVIELFRRGIRIGPATPGMNRPTEDRNVLMPDLMPYITGEQVSD